MGTRPIDWPNVAALAVRYPTRIVPAFGIHPWYAYMYPKTNLSENVAEKNKESEREVKEESSGREWMDVLRGYLINHPTAMVGEIGVDHHANVPSTSTHDQEPQPQHECIQREHSHQYDHYDRDYLISHQHGLFEDQFQEAVKQHRCVSVHVVRAFGYFLSFLQRTEKALANKLKQNRNQDEDRVSVVNEYLPRNIMLHSYSGSVDMLRQVMRMKYVGGRVFVSFSELVHGRMDGRRVRELVSVVPDDRVLIESDVTDARDRVVEKMERVASRVASVKGWSVDETLTRTAANMTRFLQSHTSKTK